LTTVRGLRTVRAARDRCRLRSLRSRAGEHPGQRARGRRRPVALLERCDRIETRLDRLEGRIEQVAIQLTAIDTKLAAIDTKLDTFSADTQSRLSRIETHIRLSRAPRPGKRPPRGSTKRRKAA
jgi:chromosome segregation ATPase